MKKLLELLYKYGGFALVALAALGTLVAYHVTVTDIKAAGPSQKIEVGFIGGVANLFCFGCVTDMAKVRNQEFRGELNKLRRKARNALIWPAIIILLNIALEWWRFKRSCRCSSG